MTSANGMTPGPDELEYERSWRNKTEVKFCATTARTSRRSAFHYYAEIGGAGSSAGWAFA